MSYPRWLTESGDVRRRCVGGRRPKLQDAGCTAMEDTELSPVDLVVLADRSHSVFSSMDNLHSSRGQLLLSFATPARRELSLIQ